MLLWFTDFKKLYSSSSDLRIYVPLIYFRHIGTWKQEITNFWNPSQWHGIEPRTFCSANHYTNAAPSLLGTVHLKCILSLVILAWQLDIREIWLYCNERQAYGYKQWKKYTLSVAMIQQIKHTLRETRNSPYGRLRGGRRSIFWLSISLASDWMNSLVDRL